jgi:hypothetical protein
MAIKHNAAVKEYDATPRRIKIMAKFLTDCILAEQAKCSAKGYKFRIKAEIIESALESFVNPETYKKQQFRERV